MRYRYILAFGSNLGNREANCQRGQVALALWGEFLRISQFLYTEPLQSEQFLVDPNQETFLNYIVEFHSPLSPHQLYEKIVLIEDEVGHDRCRKWAPRHLDIDILLVAEDEHGKNFGECTWLRLDPDQALQIPHAELKGRPFLMQLLTEDFQLALDL